MSGPGRYAAISFALALAACVEGQERFEPFTGAGHLSSEPPAPPTAEAPRDANAAVVAEAGRRKGGDGAVLLGQTRVAASGETVLTGDRSLGGPPVSLNIQNTSVAEAAAIVLGEALGLTYVVDPGVTGEISLRADPAVAPDKLLTMFRAALLSRGLTLTETAGIYRVGAGGEAFRGAGGGDTALFPLRNIAAEEVAKALELAVPAEQIRAVTGSNEAVLVTGTPEELDLARATINALDVDALAGNSVMLVGLEYASASTLATELAGVFGGDAAPGFREGDTSVRAGGLRIVPLERIGAVMLLAQDGATLDRAFAWVRRLDQPRAAAGQRLFIYRVQNRPAESLAESLNALFNGATGGEDGEVVIEPLQLRGEPAPRIVVDLEKNALVISAATRQFDTLIDLIRQLDAAPLQVLVETTILEVRLGDNLRYGVQYAFSAGNLFGSDQKGFVNLTPGSSPVIRPNLPGFAFTIGTGLNANAIIEALDEVSDVTVVSSPKLLVRDNQSARLQIGDQVPIVTQTSQGTDVTSTIVNSVEYRDTGVTLIVAPRINSGGYVSLSVTQEISTVSATTTSGIDSPTFSNRSVNTDVTIRDGQTVVLGGLIQDNSQGGRQGIPVLDEIPVLGAAFGTRNESAGRTELLVLLRPIILTAPEQAEDLSERLRSKFEAISRLANQRPELRRVGRTQLPDFAPRN